MPQRTDEEQDKESEKKNSVSIENETDRMMTVEALIEQQNSRQKMNTLNNLICLLQQYIPKNRKSNPEEYKQNNNPAQFMQEL